LVWFGGPQPSHDVPDLILPHVRGFIEYQKVVRSTLILLLVTRVGEGTEFYLDPLAIRSSQAPDIVLSVKSYPIAQQIREPVDHPGQLSSVHPEDANCLVFSERLSHCQISLPSTSRATVSNNISLAMVSHGLWARQRSPYNSVGLKQQVQFSQFFRREKI
jgi:hypothetical protein